MRESVIRRLPKPFPQIFYRLWKSAGIGCLICGLTSSLYALEDLRIDENGNILNKKVIKLPLHGLMINGVEVNPNGGGAGTWGSITGNITSQSDLSTALAGKQQLDADLTSIAALSTTAFGRSVLTMADAVALRALAGLNNVDNTSDLNKPVSTATQGAIESATSSLLDSGNNLSDLQNVNAAVTNLGATVAGKGLFGLPNPSAITFLRINADNSVSALTAAAFRAAIGAGTSSFDGTFSSLSGKPTTLSSLGIFDVANYGAVADGQTLYDGTFTSGSTTFTSASANFTSADVGKTIVLQISQTTRQILTIAAVVSATSVTLSANASGSSSAYPDRITVYGTDNTAAINAALTAMGTKGGELRLKEGIYLCKGAPNGAGNSIFHIPYITTYTDAAPAITIVGTNTPSLELGNPGQKPFTSGTIIYCPNQTVSGLAPSIFAGPPIDQTGYYWPGCVQTTFRIQNVTVRQPPNPKMHAFQMANIGSFFPDYVACDLDVPFSHAGNLLANPSTGGATAFLFPRKWCGFYQRAGTLLAYGYNVGAELNDTLLLDKLVAEMCYSGITATESTNFFQATHLGLYRCRTAIDSYPASIKLIAGLINIESNRGGTDWIPDWTINNNGQYDIDNYNGGITGQTSVSTVLSNVGPIATAVRNPIGGVSSGLKIYDVVTSQHLGGETFNNIELKSEQTGLVAPVVSNIGSAGSTSYTYQIGYWMADGSLQLGPAAVTATGNATLGSTNFNRVSVASVSGAVSVSVYRIASSGSPATLGKIGQFFCGPSGAILDDTALTADGVLPQDTTGKLKAQRGEFAVKITVPTKVAGTSTTDAASTAFVQSGIASILAGALSQFSANGTTSAQLAAVLSDEIGYVTGAKALFSDQAVSTTSSPNFAGLTVGSVTVPTISSTNTLTNKTISGGSNTITNINAANISTGTVADARLSGNVPLLNASANYYTGSQVIGSFSMQTYLGDIYLDNTAANDIIFRTNSSTPRFTIGNNGVVTVNGTASINGGTITNGTAKWIVGSGSPEGVVIANVGSFYSRTNGGAGTSWYVKESGTGNTGWVAK